MEGAAVQNIAELAQQAHGRNVLVAEDLSTIPLHRFPKELEPDLPKTLQLNTLQGVVDYIEANRDRLEGEKCMVHVAGPGCVRIVSGLQERAARAVYVEAHALDLTAHTVGAPLDIESATIALQTRFTAAGDRDALVRLLGNVTETAEVRLEDDGFSQSVTTRPGTVGMNTESAVPNPVRLAPYRTFREIEQVELPCILRLKRGGGLGPTVTLHEADGGAWKLIAVERVAAWLAEKIGDFALVH